MASSFISEPIHPVKGTFDPAGMSRGEPGVPRQFLWRKREFEVVEILESAKSHGECRNGSGERYVRRHEFRIRTDNGSIMQIYFQRTVGRGKITASSRWWLRSIENCAAAVPRAD